MKNNSLKEHKKVLPVIIACILSFTLIKKLISFKKRGKSDATLT